MTIKETIKVHAVEQVLLKDQRKSRFNTLPRTIEPRRAESKHKHNRWRLMHLHIAYQIIKGEDPIYPVKKAYSEDHIERLVQEYSESLISHS